MFSRVSKVLGVHARARCWHNASLDNTEPVPGGNHLDIEKAFDENFSAKPSTVPAATDPFDIDAAFDEAFPSCGGGGDGGEDPGSDSTPPVDPSDSDRSDESVAGLGPGIEEATDVDGDDEDDDGGDRDDRRHVRRMRRSGAFLREGKNIKFGGKIIGSISAWSGNISCLCRIHTKCRSPASKNWPSDVLLEDWLLAGVEESGEQRLGKEAHQERIVGAAARIRLGR